MNAPPATLQLVAGAPACPHCGRPMQAQSLEGHYGQSVPVDLCLPCRLVWFDAYESVRLSGLGWVDLLRQLQRAPQADAAPPDAMGCPRCRAALKPVHNLSRFGRFAALECPQRHGHLQSFSLLLAERGLVRPLARTDLQVLAEERRTPTCLNCGAGIDGTASTCSHCRSPLVVVDPPRLFAALLNRHGEPLPREAAARIAWPCLGCGAPLSPNHAVRCDRCHHLVVLPSALDLRPVLDAVEPLLRAALPRAARPHGARLQALAGDAEATAFHRYLRRFGTEPTDWWRTGWQAAALLLLAWWLLR